MDPDMPPANRARLLDELSVPRTLSEREVSALVEIGTGARPEDVRAGGGDAPAVVMLSSGTTGWPKALLLSHRQQHWLLQAINMALGAAPDDRYFALVAPSFAFGRNPILRLLLAGGTVVSRTLPATADAFVAMLRDEAITDLSLTPSHLQLLLHEWKGDPPALPGLRRLLASTAFLHQQERMAVLSRVSPRLHVCLGMNEVGFVAITAPADIGRAPDTVGRAMPGVTVEVVDEEGDVLPPGEIGELRVRAPSIPTGYLNAPEATAVNFRGGWFHPGDLASVDAEGFLYLHGRVDDRINRSGVKIYPIEIERALRAHPNVADAAVVGLPAARTGETPIAAVVLSAPVPVAGLQRWVRRRIGAEKVPDKIAVVPELPRNAMNKVPPAALRALVVRVLDLPRKPRSR
jgi:long-chain acyl-CoA synthetase